METIITMQHDKTQERAGRDREQRMKVVERIVQWYKVWLSADFDKLNQSPFTRKAGVIIWRQKADDEDRVITGTCETGFLLMKNAMTRCLR